MSTESHPKDHALDFLEGLARCPATPFMEGDVARYIESRLRTLSISVRRDRYGNLIAHLAGPPGGRGVPPIAFVAHMDHPGFEALSLEGDMVTARALGGVPQACFSEGVPVRILLPGGEGIEAETEGAIGPQEERTVSLRLRRGLPQVEFPRPVVFDLPDFRLDGELVHMRALDDLAGCASILAALRVLGSDGTEGEVYGVFTRAEEVGLIGARLLAQEGALPPDTVVVSLEASRTLPGAEIGQGPVIRVGDATFTFDAEAEGALIKAREELAERRPEFRAQRQLMSGGTCEASAFRYYGYRTTGIAFPLGNYHNATPEGGVGAEYIHRDDFLAGVELVVQSARSVGRRRESRPWVRMRDMPQEYRQRLSETATTPQAGL